MTCKIALYRHGEADFWQRMGPMFASAQVRRELGAAMTSDESYVWWVALDGDVVAGFAAMEVGKGVCHLRHAYVDAAYRGQGLYRRLFDARLAAAVETGLRIRVVVNARSLAMAQEHGFVEVGRRGQYTVMERGA